MFPKVVDSTILASLRACHKQFDYSTLQSLRFKGDESVHLHAGAAFARGLEVTRRSYFKEGYTPDDAVALGVSALIKSYGPFECPEGEAKSCDRMVGALEYFFSQYPLNLDPAQVMSFKGEPAVEFSFAIPLPILHPDTNEPIIFAGRFDSVVNFAGGIYANDEKTTKSLGSTWSRQWDLRGQFVGYAWALREHGLKAAGTIVTGISILKQKYECQRAIVDQPEWKINLWYEDSIRELSEAIHRYKEGIPNRRNWSESCNSYGGCPYKQLCVVQDPTPFIETYYESRPWNPLVRIE